MRDVNPDQPNPNAGALALDAVPVNFSAGGRATPIAGFGFDPPSFEAYAAAHTTADDPGRLVFIENSAEAWGMWECHTAGDELVVVMSGVALFIQEIDGEQHRVRVTAGQAIVNPLGVWHTADVEQPFSAMYLTPCPGTQHRPRTLA